MFDDIRKFIEAQIVRHGVLSVIVAPYLVLSVVVSLGLFQDSKIVLLLACFAIVITSITIISAAALEFRSIRGAAIRRDKIINGLTQSLLSAESTPPYRFESYETNVFIGPDGDSVIEMWVMGRVATGVPLRIIWAGHEQHDAMRERDKRRVTIEVRDFFVGADGKRVLGPKLPVTFQWEGSGMRVHVYFDPPLDGGAPLQMLFRWEWPGYCRGLLSGGSDDFGFQQRRTTLVHANGRIVFHKDCKISELFSVRHWGPAETPPRQVRNPDGSVEISMAFRPEPGETALPPRVGITLDRPGNSP